MHSKPKYLFRTGMAIKDMKFFILGFILYLCISSMASATQIFSDPLNGSSYNNDNHNVTFVSGYTGLCAKFVGDDSYVRYPGEILPADSGTVEFYWKPPENIYDLYSYRHSGWTDFGSYKPPSGGFLIDNIGWRAAPVGSFSLELMAIDWKNPDSPLSLICWRMWSGSKWYDARNYHCSRPTLYAEVRGSKVSLSWNSTHPIWLWDPNVWYRITVTWGSNGLHLYVNGKEWGNNSYKGSICTSKSFALGQDPGYWPYGPHSMRGFYDEFRIYDEQIVPTPSNAEISRPAGYVIYYGKEPGNYTHSIDVGNVSSYELTLTPGKYYFAIAAKTSTGFIGPLSKEVEVNVSADVTPPVVIINSPRNTTYTTPKVQINVSASDPSGVDKVIAEIDGSINVTLSLSGGYYVGSTPVLRDGLHSVRIYANDTFGNVNSSVIVYFTIKTLRLANSPWPMFKHDLNHTGRSPYASKSLGGIKWSVDIGDYASTPVIGEDGTVYVVGSIKYGNYWHLKLYAIYPNGSIKWSSSELYGSMSFKSPALAGDGTVYVHGADKLYAFYPNGTVKWSVGTVYSSYSSPAIDDSGTIYIGDNLGRLFAISPDGSIKWAKDISYRGIHSSPAIGRDGTIYVGTGDGAVYAINPDGSIKWSYSTGDQVLSSPAIDENGIIYIGSNDGKLYVLYPNGNLKWKFSTGGKVYSSPSIGSDGTIYFGSEDGKIYALYPNGTLKWSYSAGQIYWSSPTIDENGVIYIGSRDGMLYAIYPNGTLKWRAIIGKPIHTTPVIASDGTVYIGGGNGVLYAIGDTRPAELANSSWPTFMHDLKNTGRTSYSVPHEVDAKWVLDLGRGVVRPPVIGADGTIYVGLYDSNSKVSKLFAVNPNGTIKWNYSVEDDTYGLDSSPVISSDGSICFLSGHQGVTLYCLYPNGTLKWSKFVTPYASTESSPIIASDTIYFGTNGEFYAYSIDGSERWHYPGYQISISSSPVMDDDGTVYFGDNRGNIHALYPNGTKKWTVTIGSSVYSPSSPSIDEDGVIYIGHRDGYIYALYPNGTQKWKLSTDGVAVYSTPAIGKDGTVYIPIHNGTLYAIYPNGTVKWSLNTGGTIGLASPVIDNSGTVYICSGNRILAINPNGTQKWIFTASGSLAHMTPAIGDDGTIYIGTNDGKLYALNDVIPPRVSVISPQNNTTYTTPTIQINVSISDPSGIAKAFAQIDGTTNLTLKYQNGYYVNATVLPNGDHWIRIFAEDNAGNVNSSVIVYFKVNAVLAVIYVPDNYTKIKWAVENATSGSTIYVRSGVYDEYGIDVNKSVKIIGIGYPILAPSVEIHDIYGFKINANDVYISGMRFGRFEDSWQWHAQTAVWINANNVTLENLKFEVYEGYGVDYAVWIEGKNVTVKNCTFNSGTWHSGYTDITVKNSENVRILNNSFIEDGNIIYIENSRNVVVRNNLFEDNRSYTYTAIQSDRSSEGISIINNCIKGRAWFRTIEVRSSDSLISGNLLLNVYQGIEVSCENASIENNVIDGVLKGFEGGLGGFGIYVRGSSSVRVINNTIGNSSYIGMWIEGSDIVLRNNTMVGNLFNFRYDSGTKRNDIDTSNRVDGKSIYYFYNRSDFSVDFQDAGMVILSKCRNVTIRNVKVSKNFQGIVLSGCKNVTISNTTVTGNYWGIWLDSENVSIKYNDVYANYEWGINAAKGDVANLIIEGNSVHGNGNGILIEGFYGYYYRPIRNVYVIGNEIYNNTLKDLAEWDNIGLRIALTNENFLVADNEIHGNYEGIRGSDVGYLGCHLILENNRIYNNTDCGVWWTNGRVNMTKNELFGNTYGIYASNSVVNMNWNNVSENDYGLYVFHSTFRCEFNEITNNTVGVATKISTTNLTYNNITGNLRGIVIEEHYWHRGSVNLTFNNIVNSKYNVVNNETYNVSAVNNWWGTVNENEIEEKILDYYDDNQMGIVFYKPYLNEPIVFRIRGDFNGNGLVDIGDVCYVAYIVIKKLPQDLRADFNGNGRVDVGDLAEIAYYLLGKISKL